jgi:hypothetical protein
MRFVVTCFECRFRPAPTRVGFGVDPASDTNQISTVRGKIYICPHRMMRWYGDGRGSFGTGLRIGCGWYNYQYNLAGLHDMNGDGNGE